jgi:hypothetical protein
MLDETHTIDSRWTCALPCSVARVTDAHNFSHTGSMRHCSFEAPYRTLDHPASSLGSMQFRLPKLCILLLMLLQAA